MNNKLKINELFNRKPGFSNDGSQCSLGNVPPRMIGNNRSPFNGRVIPEFVAAFGVAVKSKAGLAQFPDDFERLQGREVGHASNGTGILVSKLDDKDIETKPSGIGSLFLTRDSMSLRATSSAISMVSATVRPWAINPWRKGLVAKYPPSSSGLMEIGTKYSDIYRASIYRLRLSC